MRIRFVVVVAILALGFFAAVAASAMDVDGDGILDDGDNCALTPNALQLDLDGDGAGDACDCRPNFVDLDLSDADANGIFDGCEAPAAQTLILVEDFTGETAFPTTPELNTAGFVGLNAGAGVNDTTPPTIGGGVVDLTLSDTAGASFFDFKAANATGVALASEDVTIRGEFSSVTATSTPQAFGGVGVTLVTSGGVSLRGQIASGGGAPELAVLISDTMGNTIGNDTVPLPSLPSSYTIDLLFDRSLQTLVAVAYVDSGLAYMTAPIDTSTVLTTIGSAAGSAFVINNLDPVTVTADLDALSVWNGLLPSTDPDADGLANAADNCDRTPNPLQADGDTDGAGDVCDCRPGFTDPDVTDADGDGLFDLCEASGLGALIFDEDFEGELSFPTAPEVDLESMLATSFSVSGNGPPPTPPLSGTAADLTVTSVDGAFLLEFTSVGTVASTLDGSRDVAFGARFSGVGLTHDAAATASMGVAYTVSSGASFQAQVVEDLATPRLRVVEGDTVGNVLAAESVVLPEIPVEFELELLIDRVDNTAVAVLYSSGVVRVTPPLALSAAGAESVNTLGGVAAVVNNTGVATTAAGALDALSVYAAGSPADADGDGIFDVFDNCLLTPNPSQVDAEGDGAGDVCDCRPGAFDADVTDSDADGLFDACEADAVGSEIYLEDFEGEMGFPAMPETDSVGFGGVTGSFGGNGSTLPTVGGGRVDLALVDTAGASSFDFVAAGAGGGAASVDGTRDVALRGDFTAVALEGDASAISSAGISLNTAAGAYRTQVTEFEGASRLEVIESDLAGTTLGSHVVSLPSIPAAFTLDLLLDRSEGTLVGILESPGQLYVSPPLALVGGGLDAVVAFGGLSAVINNVVPTTVAAELDALTLFATGAAPDADADGIPDVVDNCVQTPNPTQADSEGDGAGDACDCRPGDIDADLTDANGNGLFDTCEGAAVGSLVYVEDFTGEVGFPTTPENDLLGLTSLSAGYSGNGFSFPTVGSGSVDISLSSAAGAETFETRLISTDGASLEGSRDLVLRGDFSTVALTSDPAASSSIGLAFVTSSGGSFRAHVADTLGVPEFEVLEMDAAGTILGEQSVPLASVPTEFSIELVVDRFTGTAVAILEGPGFVYVTPPLALSAASTEEIVRAGSLTVVLNNTVPTNAFGFLDALEVRATGLLPLAVGDNLDRELIHDSETRIFDVYVPGQLFGRHAGRARGRHPRAHLEQDHAGDALGLEGAGRRSDGWRLRRGVAPGAVRGSRRPGGPEPSRRGSVLHSAARRRPVLERRPARDRRRRRRVRRCRVHRGDGRRDRERLEHRPQPRLRHRHLERRGDGASPGV